MEKLTKIQEELKAPKSQYNSFGKYKYRSCEDVLEALKPFLVKHQLNLTISDEVKQVGEFTFIEATCTLSDGKESIQVSAQAGLQATKKGMDIAQIYGASSSYARKYALNGLFLIDDTKDADSEAPAKKAPVKKEPISDDRFWNALQAIKDGKANLDDLISRFELTPAQNTKLETLKLA